MAAATRTKLLSAAETLFYDNGFHATGIDRILAAAGVVRMTLYNHFPSKEALILAVLDRRHQRFMANLDTALAAAGPGRAVEDLVDAHDRWLQAHSARGCILIQALREFAQESEAIYQQALDAKNDLRARLRQALAIDGLAQVDDAAARLFAILEGATAAYPVMGAEAAGRATQANVAALLAEARDRAA